MPVHCDKNSCQWGNHGHVYTVGTDADNLDDARAKAGKQGQAAHANGWHGDGGSGSGSKAKIADLLSFYNSKTGKIYLEYLPRLPKY